MLWVVAVAACSRASKWSSYFWVDTFLSRYMHDCSVAHSTGLLYFIPGGGRSSEKLSMPKDTVVLHISITKKWWGGYYISVFAWITSTSHLSKGLSDIKQNGAQENSSCSSPVFMPFHIVWYFLFQVVATLWLAEIFQQPIRSLYLMVFEANICGKKWSPPHEWPSKTGPENDILRNILFGVT